MSVPLTQSHLILSPDEPLWCFISNGEPDSVLKSQITEGLQMIGLQKHRSMKGKALCRKIHLTPRQMDALCSTIEAFWSPVNLNRKGLYSCSHLVLPEEYK